MQPTRRLTILQKHSSHRRATVYQSLLADLVDRLAKSGAVTEQWLIDHSDLKGKLVTGQQRPGSQRFSDDTKSEAFIALALKTAPRCPICRGYLDPEKSMSYDHIERVRDDGTGEVENCQLTHPFCNQSIRA